MSAIPAGDLCALARKELQALAKGHGLKANAKSEDLALALAALRDAQRPAQQPALGSVRRSAEAASLPGCEQPAGDAAGAEEEEGTMADLARRLSPVFGSTLMVDSPVAGLVAAGAAGNVVQRRGGHAVAASPMFAPQQQSRQTLGATLTPTAPSTGGSGGWLEATRASLDGLMSVWKTLSGGRKLSGAGAAPTEGVSAAVAARPSPARPSAVRALPRPSLAPKPLISKARQSYAPPQRAPPGQGLPAKAVRQSLGSLPARLPAPPAPAAPKALRPGQIAPAKLKELPWSVKKGRVVVGPPKKAPPKKFDLSASLKNPMPWLKKPALPAPKPAQPKPAAPAPSPRAAAVARRASLAPGARLASSKGNAPTGAQRRMSMAQAAGAARRATLVANARGAAF